MRTAIINALLSILSLLLIGVGFYSLSMAWGVTDGNGTLYLLTAFALGGVGIGLAIYLLTNAKD